MKLSGLRRWRAQAFAISLAAGKLGDLSDNELLQRAIQYRWEARGIADFTRIMPAVYTLGIEASRRALGISHYPVQVMGAIGLLHNRIIEMQTGEGKTLTAVLPVALRAMLGKGVHVITANDYLAKRDAETMGPVYTLLGLGCGCVQPDMSDDERRAQYAADITYATGIEVGFDFLRDRLKLGASTSERSRRKMFQTPLDAVPVQRGQYCALIDEADNILIDAARTPLLIGVESAPSKSEMAMYAWAQAAVDALEPNHDFVIEAERRNVWLTERGCRRLTLLQKPPALDTLSTERLYDQVERALVARYLFGKNRDYVIVDDEVRLISEGTGRQLTGQRWQQGLHQAVEVKEGVPLSPESRTAATVTVQTLFARYEHLAGMTGTAVQARGEFRRYYRVGVTVIRTHRPCRREALPTRVFVTQAAKADAIIQEVRDLLESGRPVLIGTPSVRASEYLSKRFDEAAIDHAVLNAIHHEHEAETVARAGQPDQVTVATNMAGRGTDILLHESVCSSGGLHVIATEIHSSYRIDRQLIGRAARQGDPGTYRFFLSLEDELLQGFNPQLSTRLRRTAPADERGELPTSWARLFRRIQRKVERHSQKQRRRAHKIDRDRMKRFRRAGFDLFLEIADTE
ncbi:MAG: translocase [Planctomycetota bacterium]|nr:translocase [Planctomycetota bacterium]